MTSGILLPLVDSITFMTSTFLARKTEHLNWPTSPISSGGLGVCALFNTCSIAAANHFGETNSKDSSEFHKAAANVLGLVSGFTLTVALAKPLAERTGIVVNTTIAAEVALFHSLIKDSTYVIYRLALHLKNSFSFGYIQLKKTFEEMPPEKIGACKAYFERNSSVWDAHSLNMQVAFNIRLENAGQQPLAYSNLTTSDKPLTKEEAETYAKTVGSKATAEQTHVLYSHSITPEERPYLKEELPKIDLQTVDVEKLSSEQIQWCHKICVSKEPQLSLEKYSDFANVFFSHDLSQPSIDYEINPALPSSTKGISNRQAAYYTNYYLANPALQETLTLNKRASLYAFL